MEDQNTLDQLKNQLLEKEKELGKKDEQLEFQKRAMLSILDDIEAEKNKSLDLARELEKFKLAVDNASDHIVITDAEGIILYANKGVEKITGYQLTEVLGKKSGNKENWGGLMDSDFYLKMWNKIKLEKQSFIGQFSNRRKNGEPYDVLANIAPILDATGNVKFFVGIERDITKEKEIDKAKTEFVSLASHQLRTPLSSINWYTEMLLAGDAGAINDEQKNFLQEVYTGNQRMIELVNSLLNVSRLDLGTFTIEPEPIDITLMAESVLEELKSQIIEKKLKIGESYGDGVPKQFLADKKLLRIIFQNLLSNAVKYTPVEGVVDLKISAILKNEILGGKEIPADSLVLSVADSGIGIPDSQKGKIFSKLFRADNARETEAEGTGLGLYIIKSITEQSGGEAWFESAIGKGTTFYVQFPLGGMKKKEGSKTLD
ncbi:MAG: PAS domain-containing sensor histidine kinase [Candidatus Vogelbacteria bacterium]|nr:PAS domain-containing sensor histidine kinase [Candidatus Vogelbacteria bacterium]